jgi:hypothetical protein
MSIYANLSVDQGADFSTTVYVDGPTNDPVDLTTYTVFGQIRKSYSSSRSVDFEVVIADADAGEILLKLSSSVTSAMKPGRYVYDVILIDDEGKITKFLGGQLEVNPSVSRLDES